tara:strand:+ start:16266 stop:16808 length:543 start_codon:yes stop_codon:yes gene_type:complete
MEEEHFGYYVINFFTGGYGIINLDYINEIKEIHNVYATPFKYLFGLKDFGKKGNDENSETVIANKINTVLKNFKVDRDEFYELIYFLKFGDTSQFVNDMRTIYLIGIRLGIGHMADLMYKYQQKFEVPSASDNILANSSQFLDMEDDEYTDYLQSFPMTTNMDHPRTPNWNAATQTFEFT